MHNYCSVQERGSGHPEGDDEPAEPHALLPLQAVTGGQAGEDREDAEGKVDAKTRPG